MDLAKTAALSKSLVEAIRFPVAVATASAKEVFFEKIIAASAFPKLKECPIVPEDVHMPKGVSFGLIFKRKP